MSDNKKYYYMRLLEGFFHTGEIATILSEEKGYEFVVLLLQMYLLSLRGEGRLMVGKIAYTPKSLAMATNHDVRTVQMGLALFEELGLIKILETGAIYMMDIQEYIGRSSTEADRKRRYREQMKLEKTYPELYLENPDFLMKGYDHPDNCPPEKE